MEFYKDPQDCPECEGELSGKRIIDGAPMSRVGGAGSDRQIKAMKKSFKKRFVNKEIDDVRHRQGNIFDESLVSAAAERIKKNEKHDDVD
jgi:hypothetical protein